MMVSVTNNELHSIILTFEVGDGAFKMVSLCVSVYVLKTLCSCFNEVAFLFNEVSKTCLHSVLAQSVIFVVLDIQDYFVMLKCSCVGSS